MPAAPRRAAIELASRKAMDRDMTLLPGAVALSTVAGTRPLNSVTPGTAGAHRNSKPSPTSDEPRTACAARGSRRPQSRKRSHVVGPLPVGGDIQSLALFLLGDPDAHHELHQVEADGGHHGG